MIISVHMPKCGGSSFRALLQNHFGRKFSKDYDFPIHTPVEQRKKETERARKWIEIGYRYFFRYRYVECLHGHFLPYKYDHLFGKDNVQFVTWLRDPIERLVSHYYFWQRDYSKDTSRPLHRRVVEEKWSLQQFAFSDELQNLYSQFLWNFPVERFDFIGITEHYGQEHKHFAKYFLGRDEVEVPQKNVSPAKKKPRFQDEGLIRELKAFHSRDYELYEYALQQRRQRTGR